MNSYKQSDLILNPVFQLAKEKAKSLWYRKSALEFKLNGDRGCCTLGGGLYAYLIPKGCRKPRRILVLRPPFPVQGEVPLYAGMIEARDLIKALSGVETEADYGRMD